MQTHINTYRAENGGITPDMVALEMAVTELKDGYVKEIDGTSYIRQEGVWTGIDHKGFFKDSQ